ncbi:flagellar hook-basal body complex protein FliE [bacterium]|nr:flagellar hook-basal body complex protein FliE [bacterium]
MANQINKLLGKLPLFPDGLKPQGKTNQSSQISPGNRQSFEGILDDLKTPGSSGNLKQDVTNGVNIELPDGLKLPESSKSPGSISRSGGPPFGDIIKNVIRDVDDLHKTAEKTTEKLVTGELEDVHQVVVAMEEAQVSFRLMMEVRNKLVEAYREVMKTQV